MKPMFNTMTIKAICPQICNISDQLGSQDAQIKENQEQFQSLLIDEQIDKQVEPALGGLVFQLYPKPAVDRSELTTFSDKEKETYVQELQSVTE